MARLPASICRAVSQQRLRQARRGRSADTVRILRAPLAAVPLQEEDRVAGLGLRRGPFRAADVGAGERHQGRAGRERGQNRLVGAGLRGGG